MKTQRSKNCGMVSVVVAGKVVLKLIAACGGEHSGQVGRQIVDTGWPLPVETAWEIGSNADFGCVDCLVALTNDHVIYFGEELPPDYREKFRIPDFNPITSDTTSGYTTIVEISGKEPPKSEPEKVE